MKEEEEREEEEREEEKKEEEEYRTHSTLWCSSFPRWCWRGGGPGIRLYNWRHPPACPGWMEGFYLAAPRPPLSSTTTSWLQLQPPPRCHHTLERLGSNW